MSRPDNTDDHVHLTWMREAMAMVMPVHQNHPIESPAQTRQAEEALASGEVPVGCVFVRGGAIIAKARNRTNQLRNVRAPMHRIFHSPARCGLLYN